MSDPLRGPFILLMISTALIFVAVAILVINPAGAAGAGIDTAVMKLEDGSVVCTIKGGVAGCFNEDLPNALRKSLAQMLTRGFDAPPEPPCPQPICPQPICYERDPDQWLGVPERPVNRP